MKIKKIMRLLLLAQYLGNANIDNVDNRNEFNKYILEISDLLVFGED